VPKQNRINKILWITSAIGAAVFGISLFWSRTKAGLGEFWGWNPTVEIVFQLVIFLSAWITQGTLVTLFILKLVRMSQDKPTREFNKANKYSSLRKLALWIAAIPGIVLSPLLIGFSAAPSLHAAGAPAALVSLFYSVAGMSFIALMPGALTMLALLVIAILKAGQKPIDPKSPTPVILLTQIILAAITTALPALGFLKIWLTPFQVCPSNCFIFSDPIMIPLAIAYLALWLVQAIIWIGNRNKLTR
jgi:hypothetical protein